MLSRFETCNIILRFGSMEFLGNGLVIAKRKYVINYVEEVDNVVSSVEVLVSQ